MPDYRRYRVPGATYFFTVVTDGRAPILCSDVARYILRTAFSDCQRELPFEMSAVVLRPDHLHAIWSMPNGETNYPKRWAVIKRAFTTSYLSAA